MTRGSTCGPLAMEWRCSVERFRLAVDTDNAAFEDGIASELGRILRGLASRLESGEADTDGPLKDSNGNTVGRWVWGGGECPFTTRGRG